MAIITLTSDWRHDDFYVGAIKGYIYSNCPNARVVDITHDINRLEKDSTAFIIRGAYKHFPKNSIHIICTNGEVSEKKPPLCFFYDNHYFIGSNTEAFKIMFDYQPEKIICLDPLKYELSTFPELTFFAHAACQLANGESIDNLGFDASEIYAPFHLQPINNPNSITAHILHIDSYKNIITDLSLNFFKNTWNQRKYEIVLSANFRTNKICRTYSDVENGTFLALFNSLGLLELAIRNGELATMASIKEGHHIVTINFKDND